MIDTNKLIRAINDGIAGQGIVFGIFVVVTKDDLLYANTFSVDMPRADENRLQLEVVEVVKSHLAPDSEMIAIPGIPADA